MRKLRQEASLVLCLVSNALVLTLGVRSVYVCVGGGELVKESLDFPALETTSGSQEPAYHSTAPDVPALPVEYKFLSPGTICHAKHYFKGFC